MKKIIPKGNASLIPDNAERVFKGEIFDVYQWQQELFDGSFATFEKLKRADTVSVFAVVDDKIIILDDEQPDRKALLALPGGRVDDTDASVLDAAKRETHEETGYTFSEWRLVEVVKPVDKMEWFMYTYLAYGDYSKDEPHIDPGEKITVMLKTFDEVKQFQKAGEKRFVSHTSLKNANSLEEFMQTPEFQGIEVDR